MFPLLPRWYQAQNFNSLGDTAAILQGSGWIRTLGGVDAYLAMRARVGGLRRADVDGMIGRGQLRVVPGARGCIWLVSEKEAGIALKVGFEQYQKRTERELQKLGVSEGELGELQAAVLEVLKKGAHTTESLRSALPKGLVRSLGEEGKKLGISSALPAALRWLEGAGRLQRRPEGHRLDTERYHWSLADRNLLEEVPEKAHAALTRIFLRSAGAATQAELAAWAGWTQKEAKQALEEAGAHETEEAAGYWLPDPSEAPPPSGLALVPGEDNYLALRSAFGPMVDPAFHGISVKHWGGRAQKLGEANSLWVRGILLDGQLVGFWEVEPGSWRGVWTTFGPSPRREEIDAKVQETATFLKEELGNSLSYGLDNAKAQAERVAHIRAMGG